VNSKLQKAGGAAPALAILEVFEKYNLTAMLSCTMELPMAIAVAAHLSVNHDPVVVTDLDSNLALISVGKTALGFWEGARTIQDVPGLGCSVEERFAAEAEKRGWLTRESVLDLAF
jgi:L-alanine-DL-glutamate epimerase-like enolase superfamily enzyme